MSDIPYIVLWDKELASGVELLDNQHKEFLQTANLFLVKSSYGCEHFDDCLRFLESFVQYHFQAEESYMVRSGYPLYRDHQARHSALATQVKFLRVKLKKDPHSPKLLQEFNDFLTNWVQQHLMGDDLAFCRYYVAQVSNQA